MYWNRLLDIATKTNATIVVTDLLPVVEERYTEQASLIRCNSDVEKYNEIIENICKQRNILFFSRYDKWIKRDYKIYIKMRHILMQRDIRLLLKRFMNI